MEKIIILDFGGQYTQLIAKRVRESFVFSEILPFSASLEEIKAKNPRGIVFSGGPSSVYEEGAPMIDKGILDLGIPVLGICYGMQTIAYSMGGELVSEGIKEYGETEIRLIDNILFSGLREGNKKNNSDDENCNNDDANGDEHDSNILNVWMSHGDSVNPEKLPDGFKAVAFTSNHVAAIANDSKRIYGVQFHPEVSHTQNGSRIIDNFIHNICGCKSEWKPENVIEDCKDYIRKTVGKNDVICFVSGGVDSSFVATLLSKTEGIGNVYPIYIEGLMRKNETKEVKESLEPAGVRNLIIHRAEEEFITVTGQFYEPEEKRKAIGNLFGELQEKIAKELQLDPERTFLAQGTLYTDLIESGHGVGKNASNIKSHHNVGCEFIERLRKENRLVEPNRWMFKDEIRKVAKEIGLPENIYNREPFPGPGLAIRVVNGRKDWEETIKKLGEKADEVARKHGLRAIVAPVKTVGVQGDHRTYSFLAVLRGERNWKNIRNAAREIPMVIDDINRVVYQISPVEGENNEKSSINDSEVKAIETLVDEDNIETLKEIDYKGRRILCHEGVKLSQTIFIIFGADLNNSGKRSVALRGVFTDDFMTVRPAKAGEEISWEVLDDLDKMIKEEGCGSFVIDVTDKPPATTCWE